MKRNYYTKALIETWHKIEIERVVGEQEISVCVKNRNGYRFCIYIWFDKNRDHWMSNSDFGDERWTVKGALQTFLYKCYIEMREYDKLAYYGLLNNCVCSYQGETLYLGKHNYTELSENYFKLKRLI